jgi:DNA-binding winged helix-turn-helix (wHTH) protein/tetratricopeptide (TPR) repeat protein
MSGPVYVFGDCRLDTARRELRRAGTPVQLSPKAFDCLTHLIEHRDRAVGRDELVAAVWGATEATDAQVGQAVLKARRAVGDSGDDQQWIRTMPRFGYRWISDVAVEELALGTRIASAIAVPSSASDSSGAVASELPPAASDVSVSVAAVQSARTNVTLRVLVLAFVLTAFAGVVIWRLLHPSDTGLNTGSIDAATHGDAIAVMPVDVNAGDEWAWARFGVMDAIATRLRTDGEIVVATNNIIALTRTLPLDADEEAIEHTIGAKRFVRVLATHASGGWTVRLSLHVPSGPAHMVEARGEEVIGTARLAADRLMVMMGRHPPATRSGESLDSIELLQQVDLAILSDDYDSARKLLDEAAPTIQQLPETRLRRALLWRRTGQIAEAKRLLAPLLGEVSSESDPMLRARILNAIGSIATRDGRYEEAEQRFSESIGLLQAHPDPATLGNGYLGRGTSFAIRSHYDEALADYARARVTFDLAGDMLAIARVESNEGVIDMRIGRYAEALPLFEHAEAQIARFDFPKELLTVISNHVEVLLGLLRAEAALAVSDRGLPLVARIQDKDTQRVFTTSRASALAATGRISEARALLRETQREIDVDNEPLTRSGVQLIQAHLDYGDNRFAESAALARAAVAAMNDPEEVIERAQAWLIAIRAMRAIGDTPDADAEIGRFRQWSAGVQAPVAKLYATLAAAEQGWDGQHRDDGRAGFEDALSLVSSGAAPQDVSEVAVAYGDRLIEAGELDRAAAVVGQVSRWREDDFDCALLHVRLYRALRQHDAWQVALKHARRLAGERPVPAAVSSEF